MFNNFTFANETDINVNGGLLTGLCIYSAITVAINGLLLVALKYTTAGKSSILVFTRSLCAADLLIGVYGIFKTILLQNAEDQRINCFLPDSIFMSASTTICLTLLWLNMDSYLRLTKPIRYGNSMDKGNVIIAMMLVWNAGFVIGFLPQLGWNNDQYSCNFFEFYSVAFTLFTCLVWTVCMGGSVVLQVRLVRLLARIQQDLEFMSHNTILHNVYYQLVLMIRTDMILLVLGYLPFVIYICVFIARSSFASTDDANSRLVYFLPLFLSRSFLSAFSHTYRTIQLHGLSSSDGRRSLTASLRRPFVAVNSHRQPKIFCSHASHNQPDSSNTNIPTWTTERRKRLYQTISSSTITTDLESDRPTTYQHVGNLQYCQQAGKSQCCKQARNVQCCKHTGSLQCCKHAGSLQCCRHAGSLQCCKNVGSLQCCKHAGSLQCCRLAGSLQCCKNMGKTQNCLPSWRQQWCRYSGDSTNTAASSLEQTGSTTLEDYEESQSTQKHKTSTTKL